MITTAANSSATALVDANDFYVSCERVFQPALLGRPVAVLSNNDGCLIARSADYVELKVNVEGVFGLVARH